MCNLYSHTKGQQAIREMAQAVLDLAGNLEPQPAIFPDGLAPIVRVTGAGQRELVKARWGMPGPAQFGGYPITNIRNTSSAHWRRWLGVDNRCVVPFTSFCEYADTKPRKTPTWLALGEDRPLAFFAGICCTWHGVRGTKAAPVEGEHLLYGFLTTDVNSEVAPIHPKAMPVVLRTAEEIDAWLTMPTNEAMRMQRPLPDGTLQIVATGEKSDGGFQPMLL